MSGRYSNPVAIHYKPQVSLEATLLSLSGEEELINARDWSREHTRATVEGPSNIHIHLSVLDSVHFASQCARVGSEEMHIDLHCKRKKNVAMMSLYIYIHVLNI